MDWIRRLIADNPQLNRHKLSKLVCRELGWLRINGHLKDMSCRVAMLRMYRDGLITLPAPTQCVNNTSRRPRITSASDPREPLSVSAGTLGRLRLQQVQCSSDSSLWNELVERYHYLGFTPLAGAQIRYLVFAQQHLLAALSFGASAWSLAPRDTFIGWTADQRIKNLHLVVNNARFLILPWIQCRFLASRILSCVAKELPSHWRNRYGYNPVLFETFVLTERHRGTCYRAANWIRVGRTQGRGKLDRHKRFALPVKDIFLYPLHKHFRDILCVT